MSTLIKDKPSRLSAVPCDSCFVVEKGRESLADYVRRLRSEKRLSLAEVSQLSGSQITRSHISRIENGELSNVGLDKLRALAKGLGVSEEELFAVARGKSTSGDLQLAESRLLEYFRLLSPDRQADALTILEAMSQRLGAAPVDESLPHGGRQTIRVRAGKYVSQHTEKALRKKQG